MDEEIKTTSDNNNGTDRVADIKVPEPYKRDSKGRLLPGHKGGPGRPKGQSLKEYWKQKFAKMTDDEKRIFTETVSAEMIWKMAEGNPSSATDVTSGGEPINIMNYERAKGIITGTEGSDPSDSSK
jgi:hypothetical protein